MDSYQQMKIVFHFFSFVFLIYLIFYMKSLPLLYKLFILIIALVHLYDSWWFVYKYTPEKIYAPI